MANFVKSRTPDQCRTHHQKIESKLNRTSKILEALKAKFGPIDHEEIVRKCEQTEQTEISPPECM